MILTEENKPGAGSPEWLPLTEVARRVGVSHAKLSRWVKQGRIQSRHNPYDERQTQVDLVEVKRIFNLP